MRPSFCLFILLLLGPALLSPSRSLSQSPAPSTQHTDIGPCLPAFFFIPFYIQDPKLYVSSLYVVTGPPEYRPL